MPIPADLALPKLLARLRQAASAASVVAARRIVAQKATPGQAEASAAAKLAFVHVGPREDLRHANYLAGVCPRLRNHGRKTSTHHQVSLMPIWFWTERLFALNYHYAQQ